MSHSHQHRIDFGRAFAIAILLNTAFIGAEVIFGLLSDSLTLLADAGHNLSDVMGLLLACTAHGVKREPQSDDQLNKNLPT
jgi:cobalt-zinc-cadmium efflux system protein